MGITLKNTPKPKIETEISKLREDLTMWESSKKDALLNGDSYGYGYACGVSDFIRDLIIGG